MLVLSGVGTLIDSGQRIVLTAGTDHACTDTYAPILMNDGAELLVYILRRKAKYKRLIGD